MAAIGASLALVAIGAILKWAVTAHVSWIDLQTAGTVIFVIGLVALVIAIVYTFWWGPQRSQGGDSGVTRRGPDGGAY
jgi:hypothetical protein